MNCWPSIHPLSAGICRLAIFDFGRVCWMSINLSTTYQLPKKMPPARLNHQSLRRLGRYTNAQVPPTIGTRGRTCFWKRMSSVDVKYIVYSSINLATEMILNLRNGSVTASWPVGPILPTWSASGLLPEGISCVSSIDVTSFRQCQLLCHHQNTPNKGFVQNVFHA